MKRFWGRYFDRDYKTSDLIKDLIAGLIIGLVSIPISMGYAQVAGLPMVYGLYGSLLPILLFALLTSTKHFIFGVDAAPAAMVGHALMAVGVEGGTEEAIKLVPVITLAVAMWLFLFYLLKAGRIVRYISTPVMGGFVTGICLTIILMQIPKLYGADSGLGELDELVLHIGVTAESANVLSLLLGTLTLLIIVFTRKILPKFPTPIFMMAAGILLEKFLHLSDYGVKLLPKVKSGLPKLVELELGDADATRLLFVSMTIALVIMAETLLASKNDALKDGRKIKTNQEILAYGVANAAAFAVGAPPVNGSVSRSSMARQYEAKSQLVSVVAAITMLVMVLRFTFLIEYMPVPMLTAIVIGALLGACEFDLAVKLFKNARREFYIFLVACAGVLVFGTMYGVMIGVFLSFVAVIIRVTAPPRGEVGVIPGMEGFYSLRRYRHARRIANTVLYRFAGNLFFANIDTFETDIEAAVDSDTEQVIVIASGISDIDVTAAERLVAIRKSLAARGIRFYMTDHISDVNDLLRAYGAETFLYEGVVRRNAQLALRDAGIHKPYPLEPSAEALRAAMRGEKKVEEQEELLDTELEWVFGKDAPLMMDRMSKEAVSIISERLDSGEDTEHIIFDTESDMSWGRVGLLDEDELLDRIELQLMHEPFSDPERNRAIEKAIEERRAYVEQHIEELSPGTVVSMRKRRRAFAQYLKAHDPEGYTRMMELRDEHLEKLAKINAPLAAKLKERK